MASGPTVKGAEGPAGGHEALRTLTPLHPPNLIRNLLPSSGVLFSQVSTWLIPSVPPGRHLSVTTRRSFADLTVQQRPARVTSSPPAFRRRAVCARRLSPVPGAACAQLRPTILCRVCAVRDLVERECWGCGRSCRQLANTGLGVVRSALGVAGTPLPFPSLPLTLWLPTIHSLGGDS